MTSSFVTRDGSRWDAGSPIDVDALAAGDASVCPKNCEAHVAADKIAT